MGDGAQAASGRDNDLNLSNPHFEPLVGSQAQPNAYQSFEQDYYSAGGRLLNPSYNGSSMFPMNENSVGYQAPWNPQNILNQTQFGANTNRTINSFGGDQEYGVLSAAPSYNPRISGSMSSPGASVLQPTFGAGVGGVQQDPAASRTSAPGQTGGAGGESLSSPPTGKTGAGGAVGALDSIFGKNADVLKKVLGFAGSMGIEKVVKTPNYPDLSGAAASIMAQGPTTAAGQEAERRMVDYLQKGPQITPISEEYIAAVSKMFDDEQSKQLQMIDAKMQAAGAGGFGGGSGDSQYLKAQVINKYSLEKLYYVQKLLDERMREDTKNYYQTLNKVYGISEDEIQELAKLEIEELAKQFELDYTEAEDLKKALNDMVYEFTWGESDKLTQVRASLGERVLQQVISGMNSGGQPNGV